MNEELSRALSSIQETLQIVESRLSALELSNSRQNPVDLESRLSTLEHSKQTVGLARTVQPDPATNTEGTADIDHRSKSSGNAQADVHDNNIYQPGPSELARFSAAEVQRDFDRLREQYTRVPVPINGLRVNDSTSGINNECRNAVDTHKLALRYFQRYQKVILHLKVF